MSKIITESKNLAGGIEEVIFKSFKGLLISFSLPIITTFLEYTLNITWINNYFFFFSVIILINLIYVIKNYKKSNLYYIAGWTIGIGGLLILNLIDLEKAIIYLIIPIIIVVIKNLLRKK